MARERSITAQATGLSNAARLPTPVVGVMHKVESMKHEWTEADFDNMSWHDNSVHGLSIVEGNYGAGELILDLDYILEWLPASPEKFQFRVVPVTLTFHETTNLRINIDYAKATASLTPFTIGKIYTKPHVRPNGYVSKLWEIMLNWPHGEITFESSGFTQIVAGSEVLSENQYLSKEQREAKNA